MVISYSSYGGLKEIQNAQFEEKQSAREFNVSTEGRTEGDEAIKDRL